MSAAEDTRPGPGHLASIDVLIAHADAMAIAARNKIQMMSAGAAREVLGDLQTANNRARHAADWLRKLAADIRAAGGR